jgi:hypothetical protein
MPDLGSMFLGAMAGSALGKYIGEPAALREPRSG